MQGRSESQKTNFNDGVRVKLEAAARDAFKATVEVELWCRGRGNGEGMEAAKAEEMNWSRMTEAASSS